MSREQRGVKEREVFLIVQRWGKELPEAMQCPGDHQRQNQTFLSTLIDSQIDNHNNCNDLQMSSYVFGNKTKRDSPPLAMAGPKDYRNTDFYRCSIVLHQHTAVFQCRTASAFIDPSTELVLELK